MRLIGLVLILGILLTATPVVAQETEIFPILSVDMIVNPNVWGVLVNDMSQETAENYTVICRSNATNAYARIDFYNNDTLTNTEYFSFSNFTIFSFRLTQNVTKFDMVAENLGAIPMRIYLDLYNQTLENLQGVTFIVSPVYVDAHILITQNVTIIQREVVTERIIDVSDFQAIMIGLGGFCVMIVYIAIQAKKKEEKPINKMSIDELFDEFRKGK